MTGTMKYRVRIMDGINDYDELDTENLAQAFHAARALLRQSDVENLADPFAVINTLNDGKIDWNRTHQTTLGPDGVVIR